MFAFLKTAEEGPESTSGPIVWTEELIASPQQQVQQQLEPSFLDRLAAPTVFLQQALLFDTSLDVDGLRTAVASVVEQYPPFGERLTKNQVGTAVCSWVLQGDSPRARLPHAHSHVSREGPIFA